MQFCASGEQQLQDRTTRTFSGSYSARTIGCESSILIAEKVLCCAGPLIHWLLVLGSSLRGWLRTARRGENFPSWFALPKNRHSFVTFLWVRFFVRADVLWGSADTSSLLITCPRKCSCVRQKDHFSVLRVAPDAFMRLRTAASLASCRVSFCPKTSM